MLKELGKKIVFLFLGGCKGAAQLLNFGPLIYLQVVGGCGKSALQI